MNNVDRAEETIRRWMPQAPDVWDECARQAAKELDNAGLLMPDLPESLWPNGIPTNRDSMSSLCTSDGKVYACINAGYDSDNEEITPDEAIEWVYDLIAAARQAQQEQGNG